MRGLIRILLAILLLSAIAPLAALAGTTERIEQACREYVLAQTQWVPEKLEIEFRRYIQPKLDWTGTGLRVKHPRNADLCGMVTDTPLMSRSGIRSKKSSGLST